MSDAQFRQYENVHEFCSNWLKYTPDEKIYTREIFRRKMQFDEYVELKYKNPKNNKPVVVYLLSRTSKYADKSQELRRLLTKITKPTDVILISKAPFKSYAMKSINKPKHLRIKTFLHENFNLIIPKGPLCFPHRIMTHAEVDVLLNDDLCCKLNNLPTIPLSDPQCIWIGAEVGDVIEITPISDIMGEHIQYRRVMSNTTRVVSFRNLSKPTSDTSANNSDHEDDEIQEFREEAGRMTDDELTDDDDE